uniref:Ovule protein n=1 Tax=Romanomermis culicivorax TaxID=13658 RepID=A0A915LAG0_ROMCU
MERKFPFSSVTFRRLHYVPSHSIGKGNISIGLHQPKSLSLKKTSNILGSSDTSLCQPKRFELMQPKEH